jgi:hypothetical protein
MEQLTRRDQIEIRIGNVPLGWKLNALSAALVSIREAHRDTMAPACWAAINRALNNLGEAELNSAGGGRRTLVQPKEAICAGSNAPGCNQRTTPAGDEVAPAGSVGS